MTIPPKPRPRPGRIGALRFLHLLRKDILSAQSDRLYRAKMADFRVPFFRSVVVNDPKLVRTVLVERPRDFPKSPHLIAALQPLLGKGVFLANSEDWSTQARTVRRTLELDPHRAMPHILWAGQAALARLEARPHVRDPVSLEPFARHVTADVMVRLLFGRPITDQEITRIMDVFDTYQASAPLVSLGAIFPSLQGRWPLGSWAAEAAARELRKTVARWVARHRLAWVKGKNPSGLVTRLFNAKDPESGAPLSKVSLVDQVTTFLLAGHETSAATLAWALYLLALNPVDQAAIAEEAADVLGSGTVDRSMLPRLERSRDAVRETLRLYPALPMLLRETTKPETFRQRRLPVGAQVVISPWHLHRHVDHWTDPDAFRPSRWRDADHTQARRDAYLPFGLGERSCPGAGLAMAETILLVSLICRDWSLRPTQVAPRPFAKLTLRAEPGLMVTVTPRRRSDGT
ncbi:MAG: cytochrome P450 [Pseudomonadota bacterium]